MLTIPKMIDQSSQIAASSDPSSLAKPVEKNKKKLWVLIFLALVLLIGVAGLVFILFYKNKDKDNSSNQNTSTTTSINSTNSTGTNSQTTSTPSGLSYTSPVYFLRREMNNELWVVESDGSNPVSLNVDNVNRVVNGLKESWVYFVATEGEDNEFKLRGLNISTYEVVDLTPKSTVDGSPYIQAIYTSPDGNVLVYDVQYRQKVCVEICSEIDPYPTEKNGYFAYNISTKKTTYLGDFFIVRNWDKDSKHLYAQEAITYHEYVRTTGTNKINVETGDATFMDVEEGFDSFSYIEEKGIKMKVRSVVSPSLSRLTVMKDGVEKEIDTGSFADIQPHLYISPDRNKFIYQKIDHRFNGRAFYKWVIVDLNTLEKKDILLPEGDNYLLRPFWVSADRFIIINLHYDKDQDKETESKLWIVNAANFTKKELVSFSDVDLTD